MGQSRASQFARAAAYAAALLASPPAAAQNAKDQARTLFEEAAECVVREDWACACPKFEASLALQRRASTLLQVAICKRLEKNYTLAWTLIQEAGDLNRQDTRTYREGLDRDIQTEMARIPTVRVTITSGPVPDGLVITFNGREIDTTDVGRPNPVDLGDYEVTARAPGFAPASARIAVRSEQSYTVALTLVPTPADPSSTPQATPGRPAGAVEQPLPTVPNGTAPARRPDSDSGGGRRAVALVLGGAGLIGTGIASWLGIRTLNLVDESNDYCAYPDGSCDPRGVDLRDEARTTQTAAIAVGVPSVALLVTGLVLFLNAPSGGSGRGTTTTPALTLSGSGISGRLTW